MVGHGFGGYERELRSLLSGDRTAVRSYARSLPPPARPGFEKLIDEPFLVIRGAGSLGLDLVALRRQFAFPIEVKASSEAVIRFSSASGRANLQLEAHRRAVERVGLMVLYAYRRLGARGEETWRVFVTGIIPSGGVVGAVCRGIPPVSRTKEGSGILRWEEGMPLSQFIERFRYLSRPSEAAGG
ncbi:MAG: Holliday junction resolvase [Thermoplasmata archaeon]|nr:Holliday junction resolvase [Thermoplasmata archaeon]